MKMSGFSNVARILAVLGIVCFGVSSMAGCGGNNPTAADAVAAGTASSTTPVATLTAGTGKILGQVVTSTSGAGVQVSSITVTLLKDATTIVSKYTTEALGGFFFNNLAEGIYILRIDKNASATYQETAQIVEVKSGVTLSVTMQLFSVTAVTDVSTIDIAGNFISALDNAPLSVAQLTLDSGQTTVTNAQGHFYFQYVASGTRRMYVNKPGLVASYAISFEVRGTNTPIADKVTYNGQTFTVASGTIVANNEPGATQSVLGLVRLAQMGTISLTYDIHQASIFIGTVLQNNRVNGVLSSGTRPVPYFEFELWVSNGTRFDKFRTVVTDANGTFKVDNVPHSGDNGYHWAAVASGTFENYVLNTTNDIVGYYLDNPNPPWGNGFLGFARLNAVNRTIVYYTTFAYVAESAKTTVMDFTIPTFFPFPFN